MWMNKQIVKWPYRAGHPLTKQKEMDEFSVTSLIRFKNNTLSERSQKQNTNI